jgi:hypothetical protein
MAAAGRLGAVRGNDPRTGFACDDTKRCIDAIDCVTPAERQKIFSGTAKKVLTRRALPQVPMHWTYFAFGQTTPCAPAVTVPIPLLTKRCTRLPS